MMPSRITSSKGPAEVPHDTVHFACKRANLIDRPGELDYFAEVESSTPNEKEPFGMHPSRRERSESNEVR
jgi:hypothetical protein